LSQKDFVTKTVFLTHIIEKENFLFKIESKKTVTKTGFLTHIIEKENFLFKRESSDGSIPFS